jgi:hypothetical protein
MYSKLVLTIKLSIIMKGSDTSLLSLFFHIPVIVNVLYARRLTESD